MVSNMVCNVYIARRVLASLMGSREFIVNAKEALVK